MKEEIFTDYRVAEARSLSARAKMGIKNFVRHYDIFATNASVLRVIENLHI